MNAQDREMGRQGRKPHPKRGHKAINLLSTPSLSHLHAVDVSSACTTVDELT